MIRKLLTAKSVVIEGGVAAVSVLGTFFVNKNFLFRLDIAMVLVRLITVDLSRNLTLSTYFAAH